MLCFPYLMKKSVMVSVCYLLYRMNKVKSIQIGNNRYRLESVSVRIGFRWIGLAIVAAAFSLVANPFISLRSLAKTGLKYSAARREIW